jgi:hypothetical protein
MSSKRRERERRPARRTATREPTRRLLVVSEGKVTEPEYLRGFWRWVRNNTIEIVFPDKHGVPLTLVKLAVKLKVSAEKQAKRERDGFLAYDEVWCVFDIDEHPGVNDARQLARARGIKLAVSNPCFELWILLHFRESPGPRHRHNVMELVAEKLPGYDKHLRFDDLASGVEDADRRARALQTQADEEGEPHRNPTTGVYRLTESIARKTDS